MNPLALITFKKETHLSSIEPYENETISLEEFNEILNQPLPEGFAMPIGNELDWKDIEYQRAANVYFIKLGRVDKRYPNYRPTQSILESIFKEYTRKAKMMRNP
jgi:hypothetical protein